MPRLLAPNHPIAAHRAAGTGIVAGRWLRRRAACVWRLNR